MYLFCLNHDQCGAKKPKSYIELFVSFHIWFSAWFRCSDESRIDVMDKHQLKTNECKAHEAKKNKTAYSDEKIMPCTQQHWKPDSNDENKHTVWWGLCDTPFLRETWWPLQPTAVSTVRGGIDAFYQLARGDGGPGGSPVTRALPRAVRPQGPADCCQGPPGGERGPGGAAPLCCCSRWRNTHTYPRLMAWRWRGGACARCCLRPLWPP